MVMQELYAKSVAFGTPIRYRTLADKRWLAGESVELQRSELMFLCDMPLELNTDVEMILPTKVRVMGRESPLNLLCSGTVVRRFLSNWSEVRPAMVVKIVNCQIAPENEAFADAKPTGTEDIRR